VIPKDAEELEDGRSDPSGLHVKKPSSRSATRTARRTSNEALMSPKAALVAPDVTPDSMTEIDPSEVPGGEGETFKAPDVTIEPPRQVRSQPTSASQRPPQPGQDTFTTAMDTLLGKSRKPSAPTSARLSGACSSASGSEPISPESAAAAMFTAPVEAMDGGVAMSGDVFASAEPANARPQGR
jgi:hypothetical protein